MLKRLKYFYYFLLATFVRANFNIKNEKFKKLYSFNPAIFFNDTLSNEIMIDGVFEKEELNLISNVIDKKIFIDIGANIGNHSLYFKDSFKEIYSFEPHPKTYKLLKFNTEDFSNIKIFNFGLSDEKKIIKVSFEATQNVGGESFKKDQKQGQEVFFERFDDLYNFENSISFIKIDVEGNELDVLKSMKKNLKNNSPIISLEFDMSEFNNNNEIISFLRELGYKKFYFYKTNKPLNLRIRNIFVNFFKIIFMGYKTKIELMDCKFFDNKSFFKPYGNIIISKQEIKNLT
jgi:FkbM family methyltransferase